VRRAGRRRKALSAPAREPAGSLAWVLGTWFGSGFAPLASGTAGTAASMPLVVLLGWGLPGWRAWSPWCLAASLLLFYPAVWAASRIEVELGIHDPGKVVVDETLGTLLTFAFLPEAAYHHLWVYGAGFFLFRLLDVWKPGLIGQSQALPRGWGIVTDDVLAGLLGGALMLGLWAGWHG